jgi:hypothetical protein
MEAMKAPRSTLVLVPTAPEAPADERELQFDARVLERGDRVEVFFAAEKRWVAGVFALSPAGEPRIDFGLRDPVAFAVALAAGLKRVLH